MTEKIITITPGPAVTAHGQWTVKELLDVAAAIERAALTVNVDFGQPATPEVEQTNE
jgi:hypothetical protein